MGDIQRISVLHLFPTLDSKLVELLSSLQPDDWEIRALPRWRVKDVAAHLLDGTLRKLSMARDGYFGERFNGGDFADLVRFLDGLNADWVSAMRRLSPQLLIVLLKQSAVELQRFHESLDPDGIAIFPVSWAGEQRSANWFDIAREYTEKWHHQQQIRVAVNKPGIMDRELYFPVLDTFMRALPYVYRAVSASEGASVQVTVTGEAGGNWLVQRTRKEWRLSSETLDKPSAKVDVDQNMAWRLFTKGLSEVEREQVVRITGDPALGRPILQMTTIMG